MRTEVLSKEILEQAKYVMKEKIRTIDKVSMSDKFIQFWFEEEIDSYMDKDGNEVKMYCHSCSTEAFFSEIKSLGLYVKVINKGVKGMKTKWVRNEESDRVDKWEFDSIIL